MYYLQTRKKMSREEENLIKSEKEKLKIDYNLFQKAYFFY